MKNIALFLIISILLISGCSPTEVQPTDHAIVQPAIHANTIQTETQAPAVPPAAISTSSPEAIIATATETRKMGSGALSSPPYLVYVKKNDGKEQIVLVNQDGSGLKVIPLPSDGFYAANPSPTGEWIVFYSSPGGKTTSIDTPDFNLSLNLMHLPDGKIRKVTDLLSKDYPDNIRKDSELAEYYDLNFMIGSLYNADWSPGGDYLAFSGGMDGPSTDLYLYNIHTGEIRRLSTGSENIDFIEWFPDGNRIVYSSAYSFCEGDCSSYYVTNIDGSVSKAIKDFDVFGGVTFMDDWATNSSMMIHTTANGPGTCCLRTFDFENNKVNLLYGDSFETYAYDPQTNILAISVRYSLEDREPGTYFIDQNGIRKIAEPDEIYYLGWPKYPFILSGESTKLLSASGATKTLIEQGLVPAASRNNQYVALFDREWSEDANGLKVFNNSGVLILEIANQKITEALWRIDSEGLFYITENQLFYVGMQDQIPVLIDPSINSQKEDTNYIILDWMR